MNAQLINFKSDFAWQYYAGKFGVPFELRKFDSFGLLLKGTNTLFFTPKFTANFFSTENEMLAVGNFEELTGFVYELLSENKAFGELARRVLANYEGYDDISIEISGKRFFMNEVHVMGIVNVTPDSFSDGGKFFDKKQAVEHALELIEDGADIIDVGGESTRPGAPPVSVEEELSRVIPVISSIVKRTNNALISVDTTKPEVADAALSEGAKIVNDVSAFARGEKFLDVIRKHNAVYVLMHMKGTPQTMQKNPYYEEPVGEIYDFLKYKMDYLKRQGINKIIVDPGIGFGKRVSDNYEIINRLDEFKGLGAPVLMGVSRKSFIGKSLELEVNERQNATTIAETVSAIKGARFIRTHNVKNAVQMKRMLKFLQNSQSADK